MKTLKRLQIIAILLFIAVIIFTSFFGVYKKEDFRVVNIIKKYALGMQFTDSIKFTGTIKSEEKENEETDESQENLNKEDIKLAKKIITKRLKGMGVGEYGVKVNEQTGEIVITIQDNYETHELEEHIEEQGAFTIIDKETEEVLLNNNHIKSAKVVYGASREDANTTVVYLQISFNKEGTKKLEEISQIYIKSETDGENEEEDTKYVSVQLDGQTLSSTYFGEKMSTGVLYIPVTQASDVETLQEQVKEISNIATVINNGKLPFEYEFSEETVTSSINQNSLFMGIAVPSALLLIACIVLIIKFKVKGFIDTFLQIGYIALLLLTIRYTNVIITIEGIVGIVLAAVLNYVFNYILLNNFKTQEKFSWEKIRKFALYTAPVYVIAIILAFNSLTLVNSLGMTLVWGSICMYIYNLSITKAVLEMLSK